MNSPGDVRVVCIGGSAGGVDAMLALLGPLPAGYSLPIVLLLHLPDDHDSVLAEVLGHRLSLPVREARDKEPIEPGTIYLAPPGYHLQVERDESFSLSCDALVNHSRPSIDVLFGSAAKALGGALCAVLLTGANEDGAQGLAAVARAGGVTVVQDPATALISIMPEAALRIYPAHITLPLDGIFDLLLSLEEDHA